MLREIVHDIHRRLHDDDKTKMVLVLTGVSVNIDLVYRWEPEYMVCRGRESGTNDDNRGFFIPYAEILYVKLERTVKLTDLQTMYGDALDTREDPLALTMKGADGKPEPIRPTPAAAAPQPAAALDPAAIAKQNLLDRLRAARTSAGAASGARPNFN